MPIIVPAGTQLSVSLTSDITTRTAHVGDPVDARLAFDLLMNGRTALPAGASVHGTVTQVVSGSAKIGGGAAAGALAAHKTGGEVTVPAGSVLVVVTEAAFEVGGE